MREYRSFLGKLMRVKGHFGKWRGAIDDYPANRKPTVEGEPDAAAPGF